MSVTEWDRGWTMAHAKRDFQLGLLKGYWLHRFMGEWVVGIEGISAVGKLVDARGNGPRTFKTLDAAVSAIEQVGFTVDSLVGRS